MNLNVECNAVPCGELSTKYKNENFIDFVFCTLSRFIPYGVTELISIRTFHHMISAVLICNLITLLSFSVAL